MTQTVLLKNARLIDGIADQPQERVSILIDGERIGKVERGDLPASAGRADNRPGGKNGSSWV